jgi:Flp pilus assembly protein TadD
MPTFEMTFADSLKKLRSEFRTGHATLAELTQTPPEDVEAAYAVGMKMIQMGKDQEAIQVFGALTIISCYDKRFWRGLGLALYKTKRAKFSLVAFEAALTLDDNDVAARTYRAEALLTVGQLSAAKAECEWVVKNGTARDAAPFVARAKALMRYTTKA